MADIALRVAGAAAGIALTYFTAGAAGPSAYALFQGASAGYLAGAAIGECVRRDELSPQFAESLSP